MSRLFTTVLTLLTAAMLRAELPQDVPALQKAIHRVIDSAEPSIACILVSRSDEYAKYEQDLPKAPLGKLGGFASQRVRWLDFQSREKMRRLDLANLDTAPESYGSGIVIDPAGLILTNFHVIQEAKKIYVRLPGGRSSYADLVAYDGRADLAVLRMINPPPRLTAIKFGDGSKVRKGDFVISLANPFAAGFRDGSASASSGIVSNIRRKAGPPEEINKRTKSLSLYGTQILSDVRLNLGCSGGALLNMDGELIGLTTSLAAVAGGEMPGGYAVPLDANIKKIIAVLQRGEEVEYGFLGVNIESDERSDGRGVTITGTPSGLPAARAGLRLGDVIVRINGNAVRDHDDLFLNIGASLAGSEVDIEIRPYGSRDARTVKVKLAKAGTGENSLASNRPKHVFGLRVDFTSTMTIDSNPPEGVWIRSDDILAGSPAEKKLKGFTDREKLIVVAVNGKPVLTPADFYREAAGKSTVELDIVEAGPDATTARQKVTLP